MEICSSSSKLEFHDCVLVYTIGHKNDIIEDCVRGNGVPYIIPGADPTDGGSYCYLFSANELFYGNITGGIWRTGIFYTISNISAAEKGINEIPSIDLQLYDPKRDLLWDPNAKVRNKLDEEVLKDMHLQDSSISALINHSTVIRFQKNTYKSIARNDIKSYIGISADYEDTITFPCIITSFPLKENHQFLNKSFSGFISIDVETYMHEINIERRLRTVLNSLGVAGIFTTFYYFLFGDKKIKPWGFMHQVFRSELEQLTTYKPVSSLNFEALNSMFSSDNKFEDYDKRFAYLEGLLSDYIINTQPLEVVQDKILINEDMTS
ncbi:7299_t:CDS:2 [Ambispora leptoticha]|uniref:7299_t:CDS:1 n=1 Tax=Ambispora leptoticha TaxID=144679 RepID=A0A9N9CN22_9GLOM|nr:7299_t:CDS:2 [Ambispora leptoticha]